MLGDQVGDEQGQVTGMRVLASETGPKVEVSVQASGTLAGVDVTDVITFWSVARPDGTMLGEGHGVIMSASGDVASYSGQGIGRFTGGGGTSFRGAIYYQSTSEPFSRLNGIAVVYEYESDSAGKVSFRSWEWK